MRTRSARRPRRAWALVLMRTTKPSSRALAPSSRKFGVRERLATGEHEVHDLHVGKLFEELDVLLLAECLPLE